MTKIGMISLGCAKNLVDSEIVLGMLKDKYEIVNTVEESDIVIINTCGFIEDSKKESIENILDVVKANKKVVAIGCLVERYLDELKQSIPEVSLWVKIKDYKDLNKSLEKLINDGNSLPSFDPFARLITTPSYMAYLRISEGCNNCCTYCAIPLIRGRFKSRSFSDVINEAKMLANNSYKEIVLISQDTTRYGSDLINEKVNIVDLLNAICKIDKIESVRLLYLYPDEISDELIEFIKNNKKVAPYFDIPFQHSSNKILKAMNRRGSKEEYISLISKIRKEIPHAIIRTTFIVGFPNESEDDFVDLIKFTKLIRFDHLGAFSYSKEDKTASYNFPNQIDEKLKIARLHKLMDIQKKISYEKNKEHIGEVMEGIVTSYDSKSNQYSLRSYWNAPDDIDGNIFFTSKTDLKIGDTIKVKIKSAFVYDLYGEQSE